MAFAKTGIAVSRPVIVERVGTPEETPTTPKVVGVTRSDGKVWDGECWVTVAEWEASTG